MRAKPIASVAVALLLISLRSAQASAEEAAPSGETANSTSALPSDYYETATVRAQPLASSVGSVTVLTRDEIEELDAATVVDLLRFVGGVALTSNGGRAGVTTAQIRGGDPNFTVVLVDGVPLNDSTDQFGGAVNLSSIPVEHVERIEIVRGPVSSYYGSAGMAGVINVITRPGGGETTPGFGVAAGDASYGRITASLGGGGEATPYFVGVSGEQEDGRIAEDEFQQIALQGRHSRELGRSGSLRLAGRVTTWEVADYADGSGGPVLGSGELRQSDHDEASLDAEWRVGPASAEHRVRASGYWHSVDRTAPAIDPVVPPSAESTRFVDLRLGWDVALAIAESGRLALGIEGRQERGENESTLFLPPVAGGDVPGDYDLDRATGAALADWSGTAGRVGYELGARLDLPQGFDSQFSPRAGVAWRVREGHRLRASVARSFKLPSFYALGSPAVLGGNPDLEPERSTGGDVGYEFDAGKLGGSLTLFALRFDDLIDFDFTTFQLVNRANVDSRGAELGLVLAATKELDLRLDVGYQDVENDETGEPLRRRPEWSGGLRAVWRPVEAWRIEGDVQSVSEQLDQQVPDPTLDTVDGFVVVGGGAAYRVASRWSASLRLDNLLDEEYETLIGFPGPGRTFRASISFGG